MLRSANSPPVTPSDAELLHLFLQRCDDAAFGRLVARHGEPVRRVATRATGNPTAAEDVAQAAFIVLSRRPRAAWVSAYCRGSALPWLVRTTRYAASTWRRTEQRRRRHERAAAVPERLDPSEPGALTEALAAALSRMNRGERRLITLRHLDEKPWPDVAAQVGMSPEAARKATARALGRLRERLRHNGIVVTPAALTIALATLSRPAHAAVIVGGSSSAFLIARGVLTMMKVQTAGVAGTALVAAVMSVGVLGGGFGLGFGSAASTLAGPADGPLTNLAAQASGGGRGGQDARDRDGRRDADEARAKHDRFEANEHQPSVSLADGTRLTLVAVSNGDDGWWHADGTRSRSPRHLLPDGLNMGSMSLSVDDGELVADVVFFVEPGNDGAGDGRRRADEADAADEADEQRNEERDEKRNVVRETRVEATMLGLRDGDRKEPTSHGLGIHADNGRVVWRAMIPVDGELERTDLYLSVAVGDVERVGRIEPRDGGGGWRADAAARRWITIGRGEDNVHFEAAKPDEESAVVTVVGVTGDGRRFHGAVTNGRMSFADAVLDEIERFEVFRRPIQIVQLQDVSMQPEHATRPRLRIDDGEPTLKLVDPSVVHAGTSGNHNSVQIGGSGNYYGRAQAGGGGGSYYGRAQAGGGTDEARATASGGNAEARGSEQQRSGAAAGGQGQQAPDDQDD